MWYESMMKGNKSVLIHYQFLLLFVCFAVGYSLSWYTLSRSFSTMCSPVPRASMQHNGCDIRAFDQGETGLHKLPWNLTRWNFIISKQMSPEILRHAESKFLVINFFFTYKFLCTNTKLVGTQSLLYLLVCVLQIYSPYTSKI